MQIKQLMHGAARTATRATETGHRSYRTLRIPLVTRRIECKNNYGGNNHDRYYRNNKHPAHISKIHMRTSGPARPFVVDCHIKSNKFVKIYWTLYKLKGINIHIYASCIFRPGAHGATPNCGLLFNPEITTNVIMYVIAY